MRDPLSHRPVLYNEIIRVLQPNRAGRYVDGTLGAGGHAWGILKASEPEGRLLGLDLDPEALRLARARLVPFGERGWSRDREWQTGNAPCHQNLSSLTDRR